MLLHVLGVHELFDDIQKNTCRIAMRAARAKCRRSAGNFDFVRISLFYALLFLKEYTVINLQLHQISCSQERNKLLHDNRWVESDHFGDSFQSIGKLLSPDLHKQVDFTVLIQLAKTGFNLIFQEWTILFNDADFTNTQRKLAYNFVVDWVGQTKFEDWDFAFESQFV